MKCKIYSFLIIILGVILTFSNVSAQKNSIKSSIDPEFEMFWKEFQKAVKSNSFETINSYINNQIFLISNGFEVYIYADNKNKLSKSEFKSITKFKINQIRVIQDLSDEIIYDEFKEIITIYDINENGKDIKEVKVKTKELLKELNHNIEPPYYQVPIKTKDSNRYAVTFAKVNGKYKIVILWNVYE